MITLNDIQSALGRIRSFIYLSPCARSETFSESTGNQVYLKLDNLQRTGSFKERGALNKLLSLSPEERAQGVIAASAGNHAQGVAYHAGKLGIRAQICMPLTTPLIKVSATRGYGADVVLHGANYDEAFEEALRRSQDEHFTFVHAFDDDAVIAGQGTIGLELIKQHPDLEAVVVPIGGGGLIGGIACALKESNSKIQVFGVQPSRLPSMKVAVAEGKPVTLKAASTIADGIAVRRAGDRTLPLVQRYVDDIVTVEEEEIANAILAAARARKDSGRRRGRSRPRRPGQPQTAACRERKLPCWYAAEISTSRCSHALSNAALVKDGRLVRLRVHLPDYPGALNRLTSILAQHRANIVETDYDRAYHGVGLGETAIEITMETRGPDHIAEIISALGAAGYTQERVL